MRRSLIVGVICALLAASGVGFSQTQTFTNFILSAPTGVPTVSDILACIEGSPAKTNQCSVSSIWSVLRSITNIWSGPQEYNPNAFSLNGSTSGQLVVNAPATASGTITFPAGTTNFSATGGTSQVVKQTSAGGAFTVGQLACSDLSNAGAGCSAGSNVSSVTAADGTLTISPTAGAVTAKVATNGVANSNLAPMPTNTIKGNNTGLSAAPADLTMSQVAALVTGNNWAIAGGTADAITATYTPANPALTDGLLLFFRATAPNATTTPTFAPDGLTAHTITKFGGRVLAPNDIPGNLAEEAIRYDLPNARWELLNPTVTGAALSTQAPSDPTGTVSATFVMMGLGSTFTITPVSTGRVQFSIKGNISNSGANSGVTTLLKYGTGTAPANGDAVKGNSIGNALTSSVPTANVSVPLTTFGTVVTLTAGTAYWFDLALATTGGGGTASITHVSGEASEF